MIAVLRGLLDKVMRSSIYQSYVLTLPVCQVCCHVLSMYRLIFWSENKSSEGSNLPVITRLGGFKSRRHIPQMCYLGGEPGVRRTLLLAGGCVERKH